ncbi:hypothetical protein BDV25DRAFT_149089 [Aspergillus avenaceus]|uniref:Uncharacterized protein n=1 Tax=Aspergillus avenaceus TaxID=36643 RepID=A0A5N6U5Z3_ASPAV|nr:hypothetical protein BDV25DRAFT_149089 [Aspergillus avenaceus]
MTTTSWSPSSTSSFLPLTTTFTPPASCQRQLHSIPTQTFSDTTYFYYHLDYANDTACMPSGWSPTSYYSPGRCPGGYTVATTSLSIINNTRTDTWANCCPTGFSNNKSPNAPPYDMTEACTSSASSSATSTGSMTQSFDGQIGADPVRIIWRSEDFSPSSANAQGGHASLSNDAKAGIGIGVTLGVFIIFICALTSFYLFRKRNQRPATNYTLVQVSKDEEKVQRSSSAQNVPSNRSPWLTLGFDSWIYESIAVCFSIACLVAIVCILQIYDGQLSPNLPSDITLNTVISVLATVSKSSLVYAVGECIGQLRWISFRQSRRPLTDVQLYDSASRGPWGSLLIIFRDKCRSLVTVGAFIVILALAFDPFVQQIISYPVLPTLRHSEQAAVAQSRYLLPDPSNDTDLTNAVNSGIWADSVPLDLSCPTGNCTWPQFQSVEMCSRCADVDPSRVVLSGWNFSSFDDKIRSDQNIPVQISIENGTQSNFSTLVSWRLTGFYHALVPKNIYWIADVQSYGSTIVMPTQGGSKTVAGIEDPVIVVAHAELDLPRQWLSNETDLASAVKVTEASECAMSFCAREYNVSVTNGVGSVQVVDEDFGSFYLPDSMGGQLCWKPSSSPTTNWNKTGQEETGGEADPVNYEFCGVNPSYYYDTLPLSGTMSWNYELQTNFSDNSTSWLHVTSSPLNPSSFDIWRAYYVGLEPVLDMVAASISKLARNYSNNPIYGVVSTQEPYVAVNWPWLTLPIVLLVTGTLLLVSTALSTTRGGVSLWKSSILPLLFHGLESEWVTRDMVNERGPCESASEMDQVAGGLMVDLGPSKEGGKTVLRGDPQSIENGPVDGVLVRRRSF